MDCPFKNAKVPQITGPWRSILLIILMVPIGGVANKSINGELRSLTDVGTTLMHGIPVALGVAAGWIFFRSPWAPELRALMYQQQSEKTTTSVEPSGAVKVETVTTSLSKKEGQ